MPSVSTTEMVAEAIFLLLNTAIKYNELQRKANAEGRNVNISDLRVLQEELRANQRALDEAIAQMPPDESSV